MAKHHDALYYHIIFTHLSSPLTVRMIVQYRKALPLVLDNDLRERARKHIAVGEQVARERVLVADRQQILGRPSGHDVRHLVLFANRRHNARRVDVAGSEDGEHSFAQHSAHYKTVPALYLYMHRVRSI